MRPGHAGAGVGTEVVKGTANGEETLNLTGNAVEGTTTLFETDYFNIKVN